jgi:cell fate regulator YaaT (PSP1 superfamily)
LAKYIVRYGTMRSLGVMSARTADYRRGMEVVIRSERGVEVGQVLCESTEDELSHLDQPPSGTIVRAVGDEDAVAIDAIESQRLKEIASCQKHVDALGLEMKLIEVERLLGGQRIVVYFVSDDRVDFRELVKLLVADFETRIEMRQVGVRDEAKILADYGDCGKPVCCNNHLVKMPPVSMRMAKLQKATLDPTKISGRCGRLKCCLRYEFDTYEEIQKQLPPIGAMVVTREGKGKVLSHQILSEQLLIETEGHRRMVIEASEVLSVIKKSKTSNAPSSPEKKRTASNPESGTKAESGMKKASRNRSPRGNRRGKDSSSKQHSSSPVDEGKQAEVSSSEKSNRPSKRRRSRRRPKEQ